MSIFKFIATSAAIACATVSYAQVAEFSEIDVTVQLGESNALDLWPDIEPDMEAVMNQRITSIYNPNGLHVTISLDEVSLNGTKTLSDDGEFNTLSGLALVRKEDGGPVVQVVEFSHRAQPWEVGIADGMFILSDKADFYVAMLNRFADEMVTQIGE